MDVVVLASLYKMAAYTAFMRNYANFRSFCENVWERNELDFTAFDSITIHQFKLICNMFKTKTIIFTSRLPRNFLRYIVCGDHLIFNLSFDDLPLLRPIYP